MSTDARNLKEGDVLGPYRIERKLGEGGMGAVFAARHVKLERRVAIKVMFNELAAQPDARERFLREGRAAARLEHPNVVYVSDVDIDGHIPYLVMEYLVGEDLRSLLQREGPLATERAAALLVPVARALGHAHAAGIVHRDLKPENIFLARQPDGSVTPKILDFGISKLSSAGENGRSLTATTALMGTPHYMSPEQAHGAKQVTPASDQYTVGVILYELVTGQKPFEGDALFPLLNAIVQGQYTAPRALRPELSAEVEHIITRAMAVDTAQRFASVSDLADALESFAPGRVNTPVAFDATVSAPDVGSYATPSLSSGTPSSAAVPTPKEATQALPRRNRVLVLGVAMAAVVLLGGAAAWLTRDGAASETRTATSVTSPVPPPSAPLVSPALTLSPARYGVSIEVSPADAELSLDGIAIAERGRFVRSFAKDGVEHTLRATAAGHRTGELVFRDAPPERAVLVLEAAPAEARPSHARAAVTPASAPSRAKTSAPAPSSETTRLRQGANNSVILDVP